MPYSGVSSPAVNAKIERCVKRVMDEQGVSKSRAIAICRASIEKKSSPEWGDYSPQIQRQAVPDAGGGMSSGVPLDNRTNAEQYMQRRTSVPGGSFQPIQSRPQDGHGQIQTDVPNSLAADLAAADTLGMMEDYTPLAMGAASKMYAGDPYNIPALPGLGPTSIADALTAQEAQEQAAKLSNAYWLFQQVLENIIYSPEIDDKGAAIQREAGAFRSLLDSVIAGAKSLMGKAGARHNAGDRTALQSIHDAAVDLGAMCKAAADKGSSFFLQKSADGDLWWFAVASNKWRDDDRPAQILTDAAHKEFMAYLDQHPEAAPDLWHWHTPFTTWGKALCWDYADGFTCYAGMVNKGHEDEAHVLAAMDDIAVSHGFFFDQHDKSTETINWYRTFEISPLPFAVAANKWTDFATITKEATMGMTPTRREYFVALLGEDKVKTLEAQLAENRKALESIGVESKETPPAPNPPPSPPTPGPTPPQPPAEVPDPSAGSGQALAALIKQAVGAALDERLGAQSAEKAARDAEIATLRDTQAVIVARLKELEGDVPAAFVRPSQSNGNLLDGMGAIGAVLKDARPKSSDPKASDGAWMFGE